MVLIRIMETSKTHKSSKTSLINSHELFTRFQHCQSLTNLVLPISPTTYYLEANPLFHSSINTLEKYEVFCVNKMSSTLEIQFTVVNICLRPIYTRWELYCRDSQNWKAIDMSLNKFTTVNENGRKIRHIHLVFLGDNNCI